MPSEAQLKDIMKAAIAKKKQSTDTKSNDDSEEKVTAPSPKAVTKPKFTTAHPAIYQSRITVNQPSSQKVKDSSVANEAELIRNFFGRPIRIGVYQRQVYFCVPDVLEVSNNPEKQLKYTEFKQDSDVKKVINPLVIVMWFSNLSGGNEKLDAATAGDLIDIINQLKLPFPEPIDKWLNDTSAKITATLA